MRDDFDLIVKKFPKSKKEIHVYPVGDVHFGSAEFDFKWGYYFGD